MKIKYNLNKHQNSSTFLLLKKKEFKIGTLQKPKNFLLFLGRILALNPLQIPVSPSPRLTCSTFICLPIKLAVKAR